MAVGLVADVVEDFIGLGDQPVVVFILVGFDGDTGNLLGVDEDIINFILGGESWRMRPCQATSEVKSSMRRDCLAQASAVKLMLILSLP